MTWQPFPTETLGEVNLAKDPRLLAKVVERFGDLVRLKRAAAILNRKKGFMYLRLPGDPQGREGVM
jgi:hypothetical protein